MEASAIVRDRGVRWRRRSGDRRPTRWAMPQKNAAPRLRNPDQLQRRERYRQDPPLKRGQNWTPIRGQFWTPIDNFYWKALAGWSDELIETAIAAA